jgi:hypothetical protein
MRFLRKSDRKVTDFMDRHYLIPVILCRMSLKGKNALLRKRLKTLSPQA